MLKILTLTALAVVTLSALLISYQEVNEHEGKIGLIERLEKCLEESSTEVNVLVETKYKTSGEQEALSKEKRKLLDESIKKDKV